MDGGGLVPCPRVLRFGTLTYPETFANVPWSTVLVSPIVRRHFSYQGFH